MALGAAILSCYHTDRYESRTLQGSTDISPLLHPCVLISIGFEWTRRGYKRLLPLLIIDYWPASAESSVRSVYIRSDSGSYPADSLCCAEAGCSQAGSLVLVCALLCWCLLNRPPQGVISHSWLLWGRGFDTLWLQEAVIFLPAGTFYEPIEKYNATGLWWSGYKEHTNKREAVTLFRSVFFITVLT